MTVAVTKDASGNNWTAEAGALVLADDGLCLIDEIDKMTDFEMEALYEAMEQQTVSLSKAGIHAQMKSECGVLAAANPTKGSFDMSAPFSSQIGMPQPLISRFDLVFVIQDIPDIEQDRRLVDHIISAVDDPTSDDVYNDLIPVDLLQKYIAYARQHIKPVITTEIRNIIREFYTDARRRYRPSPTSMPYNARQLLALPRLAQASAKAELRDKVEIKDIDRAKQIISEYLWRMGIDMRAADVNVIKCHTGMDKSQLEKIQLLRNAITKVSTHNEFEKANLREIEFEMSRYNIDKHIVHSMLQQMAHNKEIMFRGTDVWFV